MTDARGRGREGIHGAEVSAQVTGYAVGVDGVTLYLGVCVTTRTRCATSTRTCPFLPLQLQPSEVNRERGLQVDSARTLGPDPVGVTLHQALREAGGLHPDAWLGAYTDWRTATANYQRARACLGDEVARRMGRPTEITVWARRAEQQDVLDALAVATKASRGADVPNPLPRLRPGCNPIKRKSSVKYSGVLVAALGMALEANPGLTVFGAAQRASGEDLEGCSNEAFLDGLDALLPVGLVLPDRDPQVAQAAASVCRGLVKAASETSTRVSKVLAEALKTPSRVPGGPDSVQQPKDDVALLRLLDQYIDDVLKAKRAHAERAVTAEDAEFKTALASVEHPAPQ